MSESYQSPDWLAAATATPHYSETELALRIKFVEEYLVDYDEVAAAIRCGFMSAFAKDFAQQLMEEAFVRTRIREQADKVDIADPDIVTQKRSRIISSLEREANYYGPGASHGARVAALAKLGSFYRMDDGLVTAGDEDDEFISGVMEVPARTSVDDWEAGAKESQAKLKEEVRA